MSLPEAGKFGFYEILALVHSDDRGQVYRARDTRLGRIVAIKLLPVPISRKPGVLEEFEREARVISSLDHPNICRLYDVGCREGCDYLVMEFLEGENLAVRLTRGPLQVDEILRSASEICGALESAHNRGFFHRDLKTSTIMLTRNGAKLLDFGLAKIARGVARSEMKLVGTPFYFAPEQISGFGPVDACCNIFSFGAIFYEMATGVSPFPAVEMRSFLIAVVGTDPVPPVQLNPQIPDDLQRIIHKCLEKERHKRYQSATETLSDLKRLRTSMEFSTSSRLRSTNHYSAATSPPLISSSLPATPVPPDPIPQISAAFPTLKDVPQLGPLRRSARRLENWGRSIFQLSRNSPEPTVNHERERRSKKEKLAGGAQLGPYQIVSLLGAGGMGEVYSARDSRMGRIVAIKVLRSFLTQDPAAKERFEREARVVSALNHPNICHLYDVGHQAGTDFLVMEYLHGETLAARLKQGALPVSEVLRYGIQITDALDDAHKRGVIHRDIEPANIFLLPGNECKILDFGLAKLEIAMSADSPTASSPDALTVWGVAIGTACYMSPEQARGERIDSRTDIFSVGATLFEMATGKCAFGGKTLALVFKAILDETVPSLCQVEPSLPKNLDDIVRKALCKDREKRYQSAAEMQQDLTAARNYLAGSLG
jgi:serine/threonine protein kinase